MSSADHNKTLVFLYSLIASLLGLSLLASPWIVARNVRRSEQVPLAVVVFCLVVCLVLLFSSTALTLYKKRVLGRKLALISAVLVLPLCWPIGVYTWWFMHSVGGKRMYEATIGK
jgi:hypothetical protein